MILEKAKTYLAENKVKRISDKYFTVKGTEDYIVIIDGSKVSCTCQFYSVEGCARHLVCSHIQACIGYELRSVWDKKSIFIAKHK